MVMYAYSGVRLRMVAGPEESAAEGAEFKMEVPEIPKIPGMPSWLGGKLACASPCAGCVSVECMTMCDHA